MEEVGRQSAYLVEKELSQSTTLLVRWCKSAHNIEFLKYCIIRRVDKDQTCIEIVVAPPRSITFKGNNFTNRVDRKWYKSTKPGACY